MGGRGASSKSSKNQGDFMDWGHGGSGGNDLDWDKNHPALISPDALKNALGDQKSSISPIESAKGANPYYSSAYREYSENCQRCVVAYELRRRGYNVIAQPTHQNDLLPTGDKWRGAFQHGKTEKVSGLNAWQLRQNVAKTMQSYGDGARAVVSFAWAKGHFGHVINVENIKGKIHYFESQVGGEYNPNRVLSGVRHGSVKIMRTDSLRISDRAKKSVWTIGES